MTVLYSRLLLALLAVLISAAPAMPEERRPVVSGTFYPADSSALDAMVREHLDAAAEQPELDGELVALIVPHAGLIYSGGIAAHGYRFLAGSGVNRVVLCGPSHRYGFHGASVYGPGVLWHTPLGTVACDDQLCRTLAAAEGIAVIPEAHLSEHSLEVQLPYLQTVLEEFQIAPVVIGYQTEQTIGAVARALASIELDSRTVMVASTDWQHYKPSTVGRPMDSLGIACILDLEPERLQKLLSDGQVEMCGGGAAVAVTRAAIEKGADRARLLRYGDSGDITGDHSQVVGYAAIALYRVAATGSKSADEVLKGEVSMDTPETYRLSDDEKTMLLQIARQSIEEYLQSGRTPSFEVPKKIKEKGAAFVTLEKQGRLRGCIGYTQAVEPLYRTVSECAIKAATADPRFRPVKAHELADLHIEISVLTPLERVMSLDEIEVGRDGLMIVMGQYRGLLLPQVATDNNWDRDTFLQQTCRKAGLPPDAYKSPQAVISRFQALIFGE